MSKEITPTSTTTKLRGRKWALLLGALVLAFGFSAGLAAAGVLTGSWVERRDGCTFTLEEYDGASLVLRMRQDGATFAGPCPIAGMALGAVLDALLSKGAAVPGGPEQRSLSLGRVVELPGLSRALAEAARASPGWDQGSGRPRRGDVNAFVAGLLLESAALREFFPAHTVESVSVEKVLVPTPGEVRKRTATDGIPDGRLPYDAQLWVRVKRR